MNDKQVETMNTIKQITYRAEEYNLYAIKIKYDYDIDEMIQYFSDEKDSYKEGYDGVDEAATIAIYKELKMPFSRNIAFQPFGCTAFNLFGVDKQHRMGRNYDFSKNTSGMATYCLPEKGYKSIAFAPLSNIDVKDPFTDTGKENVLVSPFICVDGINEKGVSIAVLVAGNNSWTNPKCVPGVYPTRQYHKKTSNIFTTLAVRLVLDRAGTTEEAIKLLTKYNMFANGVHDYHFYINDANGDGRVVEFDCDSEIREETVISAKVVTNFFIKHLDKMSDDFSKYGHGRARYFIVYNMLCDEKIKKDNVMAWNAVKASSQKEQPDNPTSNTQWSIVYNNTDLTADVAFRRDWNTAPYTFYLSE